MSDLLALAARLVDIPSESFAEQALADWFEAELSGLEHLTVDRVGDNVVARTRLGRSHRVVLAGHLDTVPVNDNGAARVEGDRLWGLGAADMKGGLAVLLDLARTVLSPAIDVTYVLYAREEVAVEHNGLRELFAARPDLVAGDLAILGEPTSGAIEAGCQGTLRVEVTLAGERAHTARAWMGRNAVHRLAPLLAAIDGYEPRQPVVEGCQYHEGLQVVYVEGGVAGNVVPDRAVVRINHRFAPDRTTDDAIAHVRTVIDPHLAEGDDVEVVDLSPAARPGLEHPLLAPLVGRADLAVRAKLGWTDVAFFSEQGIPAINLGPGDATLAHTRDEYVERDSLERVRLLLGELLSRH